MLRRLVCGASVAFALLALQATPALACGGLVAPSGDVHLDQATTFVAWHGGVEHYLTSFTYEGVASDVGWIVPLPAVPTSIEPGGRWTLQRLVREFSPPVALSAGGAGVANAASVPEAQVIQQTTVDAVDLTVLKGSAAEVLQWCRDNDFAVNDETKAHIEDYARSSPIFMAARYDVQKANALGRFQGDGTPVLITMPTPHLWVPLEVLANALDPVDADLFLLTDTPTSSGEEFGLFGLPTSSVGDELPGAPGFVLQAQKPMSEQLHTDLASDRNMSWVPSSGWVTHLSLHAQSPSVDYDMNVTSAGDIRLVSFAQPAGAAATPAPSPGYAPQPHISAPSLAALIAVVVAPLGAVAALITLRRRRHTG
jgi:hypothetical protein